MKCRDCEHWGWGDDEGTPVWGWCWIRTSCPDPDIERTCPAFSPKAPDIFTALSTLQAENEKLRAELERVKKKNKYSAHDVALILSDAFGDSCACNFNGNDEWLPEKCELLDTCPDVVGVACWEQYLKWLGQKED